MKLTNGFVTVKFKFVNNFEVNTDSRYIVVVSFHILQI